jgi:hypothetical protein
LAVCNVPVGSRAFTKAYLTKQGNHILLGFAAIKRLLTRMSLLGRCCGSSSSLACLQFMGNYWILDQTLPPSTQTTH